MADFRIQQIAHGFERLTGLIREEAAWRRCGPSESPDAVVSRLLGPDAVQVSTTGITDLSGLTPGSVYGMGPTGNLIANGGTGSWAKAISHTAIALYLSRGEGGSQQVTVIAGVDTTGFEQTNNKGAAGGYAPLDSTGAVPDQYLPQVAEESEAQAAAALHVGGHERKLDPHPQYVSTYQSILLSRFFSR